MATGIVLSVVENLISALQISKELRELCSMFNYESQLAKLEQLLRLLKLSSLMLSPNIKNSTIEGNFGFPSSRMLFMMQMIYLISSLLLLSS